MTDPFIMVGVPPILLAIIGGGAGVNNFADRREARAEAEAEEAAGAAAEADSETAAEGA